MAYHPTPLLSFGGQPPSYKHVVTNVVPVAHDIVMSGRCAHVPSEDTAELVLLSLGMDSDTVRFRIHFAKTGKILPGVSPKPVPS